MVENQRSTKRLVPRQGYASRTFLVQGDPPKVLKSYHHPRTRAELARTAQIQNDLAGAFSVPTVYDFGFDAESSNGFLIMEHLPGTTLRAVPWSVTSDSIRSLVDIIGELSCAITVNSPRACVQKGRFYADIASLIDRTHTILEERKSGFSTHARLISGVVRGSELLGCTDQVDSWIHNDLSADNVLIERGSVSGIIDFDSIRVGDLAWDYHYALAHALYAGVDPSHIKTVVSERPELFDRSGRATAKISSAYVALQPVMVLPRRIDLEPDRRTELISTTHAAVEAYLERDAYVALIDEVSS